MSIPGGFFKDNTMTHLSASCMAGFVATLATQPADVIKTRMMNGFKGEYKGSIDCAVRIVKGEGYGALYKGFFAALTRLGPQTVLTFVFLEKIKHYL